MRRRLWSMLALVVMASIPFGIAQAVASDAAQGGLPPPDIPFTVTPTAEFRVCAVLGVPNPNPPSAEELARLKEQEAQLGKPVERTIAGEIYCFRTEQEVKDWMETRTGLPQP